MSAPQPILIVDDSHDDLFILKRLLSRAGAKNPFVSFDHGDEAARFLEAAIRTPDTHLIPAAIVCDVRMPGLDGFGLLSWARRQPALAKIPFILLTNEVQPKDEERAAKLGAVRYLAKFPSEQVFIEFFAAASAAG